MPCPFSDYQNIITTLEESGLGDFTNISFSYNPVNNLDNELIQEVFIFQKTFLKIITDKVIADGQLEEIKNYFVGNISSFQYGNEQYLVENIISDEFNNDEVKNAYYQALILRLSQCYHNTNMQISGLGLPEKAREIYNLVSKAETISLLVGINPYGVQRDLFIDFLNKTLNSEIDSGISYEISTENLCKFLDEKKIDCLQLESIIDSMLGLFQTQNLSHIKEEIFSDREEKVISLFTTLRNENLFFVPPHVTLHELDATTSLAISKGRLYETLISYILATSELEHWHKFVSNQNCKIVLQPLISKGDKPDAIIVNTENPREIKTIIEIKLRAMSNEWSFHSLVKQMERYSHSSRYLGNSDPDFVIILLSSDIDDRNGCSINGAEDTYKADFLVVNSNTLGSFLSNQDPRLEILKTILLEIESDKSNLHKYINYVTRSLWNLMKEYIPEIRDLYEESPSTRSPLNSLDLQVIYLNTIHTEANLLTAESNIRDANPMSSFHYDILSRRYMPSNVLPVGKYSRPEPTESSTSGLELENYHSTEYFSLEQIEQRIEELMNMHGCENYHEIVLKAVIKHGLNFDCFLGPTNHLGDEFIQALKRFLELQ